MICLLKYMYMYVIIIMSGGTSPGKRSKGNTEIAYKSGMGYGKPL